MQGYQNKLHPDHAKLSLYFLGILLLVVFALFGLGYYAQEVLRDQTLVNTVIIILIPLSVFILILFVARAKILKCALCGSWLTEQLPVDKEEESRKFVCHECKVVWDSQVMLG